MRLAVSKLETLNASSMASLVFECELNVIFGTNTTKE